MAAAWAAAAVEAQGSGSSTFTVAVTSAAAGESIIIMVRWPDSITLNSVACTGETVDLHGSVITSAALAQSWHLGTIKKVQSGGTKNIVFTFSASVSGTARGWGRRMTGLDVDGSTILDDVDGATGNSGTGSVTLTATRPTGFGIAGYTNDNTNDPTESGGFTGFDMGNASWFDSGSEDLDLGATGSKTPTFTHTSANWAIKAALFLTPSITITTQPDDAISYNGETVQFDTAATGTGTLLYQWQVSTDYCVSFTDVSTGSGGTTDTYTTATLGFSDDQTFYRCEVTDDVETRNTRAASLRITPRSNGAWVRA